MALRLPAPSTRDLDKTSTGKLSYAGFVPAKRAARGLFVGSVVDSANTDFMRHHRISLVVNCTKDLPFRFPAQTHMRLAVDDAYEDTVRLFTLWKTAVPRISRAMDAGQSVLIHCAVGQQRSVATTAAVLMYREGLTAAEAVDRMRRTKADAFWPRVNFHRSLLRWQTWLKQHGRQGRVSRSL